MSRPSRARLAQSTPALGASDGRDLGFARGARFFTMKASATRGSHELEPLLHVGDAAASTAPAISSGGVTPTPGRALVGIASLCGVLGLAAASRVGATPLALLGKPHHHHARHHRAPVSAAEAKAQRAALGHEGAALGRAGDRVLLSPGHHLAYCNVPKAASSTLTTYITGLNAGIHSFPEVEKYIHDNGGDSHFALSQYSTFGEAAQMDTSGEYKYFTVVRHPGTRLYSSWFDKIHAHRGSDQPDLLWYGCRNNEDCKFDEFVDGITAQIRNEDGSKDFINEHVEPQSDMCNPQSRAFDGVFKIEDGFDKIAEKLREWTGEDFDFKSGDGETGYSHHNEDSKKVYSEFPVSDVEGYELLMPYDVQMKIYEAYKKDFDLFGYAPPQKAPTQLEEVPKIKWTSTLLNSEWGGEDAQHVTELANNGVIDLEDDADEDFGNNVVVVGNGGEGDASLSPDTTSQNPLDALSAGGLEPEEASEGQSEVNVALPQQAEQQQQQQQPVPSAFGGNEVISDDEPVEQKKAKPAQTQEERDYAAKKAIAEESARTKTAEEEKEWEAEVEEAKRLHDEEGLSAADAVAKAHSEAIWLKEQKTKLEHEAAIKESDEKWKKAEEDETKRLMKQEGLDWKAASAKAHSEAEWERQQEKEKIELKEQMDKAEGEKKAAVQNADARAANGEDVAASSTGLAEEDYAEVQAEKAAVQAQWKKPQPDIGVVEAEYKKWMKANGKKIVEAKVTEADGQSKAGWNTHGPEDAKVAAENMGDKTKVSSSPWDNLSPAGEGEGEGSASERGDAYDDEVTDEESAKAKKEFEKWKKLNGVDGPGGGGGDEDEDEDEASGASGGRVVGETEDGKIVDVMDPAYNPATVRVDPDEIEKKDDIELSSDEDAEKLAKFEAWKKHVEEAETDYSNDVTKPVPISADGRVQSQEEVEQQNEMESYMAEDEDEMRAWAAQQWGNQPGGARAATSAALGFEKRKQRSKRRHEKAKEEQNPIASMGQADKPPGHRLDFLRDMEQFLEMRRKVQGNHELLASEMEKIQKERPNLYALIQQNMDEFKMLLTEGLNINFGSEQAQPLPTADEVFSYLGERRR
jgi:hypothetical protein